MIMLKKRYIKVYYCKIFITTHFFTAGQKHPEDNKSDGAHSNSMTGFLIVFLIVLVVAFGAILKFIRRNNGNSNNSMVTTSEQQNRQIMHVAGRRRSTEILAEHVPAVYRLEDESEATLPRIEHPASTASGSIAKDDKSEDTKDDKMEKDKIISNV